MSNHEVRFFNPSEFAYVDNSFNLPQGSLLDLRSKTEKLGKSLSVEGVVEPASKFNPHCALFDAYAPQQNSKEILSPKKNLTYEWNGEGRSYEGKGLLGLNANNGQEWKNSSPLQDAFGLLVQPIEEGHGSNPEFHLKRNGDPSESSFDAKPLLEPISPAPFVVRRSKENECFNITSGENVLSHYSRATSNDATLQNSRNPSQSELSSNKSIQVSSSDSEVDLSLHYSWITPENHTIKGEYNKLQ